MTDVPAASIDSTAHAAPLGIMVQEEHAAIDALRAALRDAGVDPGSKPIELRALPYEGTWGGGSIVARMVAGDLVTLSLIHI